MWSSGGRRSVHLPGPAQVRRLQAAGVFPGASDRGPAWKTPGVREAPTLVGRGEGDRDQGRDCLWAGAAVLGNRAPLLAQDRTSDRAWGLYSVTKEQVCRQSHLEGPSQRTVQTPELIAWSA